jgi:hypothetical protein
MNMDDHVHPITNDEGNKLTSIVRHGNGRIEMRRAQVILASAQRFTPPKMGTIVLMTPGYVRTLIHSFNLHGFKMLKPDWKPGGNWKFTEEEKHELVSLATSRPQDLGLPFQQWSVRRLKKAERRRIVNSIILTFGRPNQGWFLLRKQSVPFFRIPFIILIRHPICRLWREVRLACTLDDL